MPVACRSAVPDVEMAHDFFPKPDDLMCDAGRLGLDRRAVRCAVRGLVARAYRCVGHRARKFEPEAAMGMIAGHGVRTCSAADRAEADAAGRRRAHGVRLRDYWRRAARQRIARLGPRRPSASTPTRCSARPRCDLVIGSETRDCFRSGRARWARRRRGSTCASSTRAGGNCRAPNAASAASDGPIR